MASLPYIPIPSEASMKTIRVLSLAALLMFGLTALAEAHPIGATRDHARSVGTSRRVAEVRVAHAPRARMFRRAAHRRALRLEARDRRLHRRIARLEGRGRCR